MRAAVSFFSEMLHISLPEQRKWIFKILSLKCGYLNDTYREVLSCGADYHAVQVVLTFKFVSEFLNCFELKLLRSSVFPAKLCVMHYMVVLNIDSVGQDILQKLLLTVVLITLKCNLMSSTSLYDLLETTRKLFGLKALISYMYYRSSRPDWSLLHQIDFSPKFSSSVISKIANLHYSNHNIDIQSKTTSILLMINFQAKSTNFFNSLSS